ncbi:MAG: hypothetical protein HY898_20525 [Deltaproteobacteria bacterium]|nr:hypothetical protein [Deltaproteobacteria bacterium]
MNSFRAFFRILSPLALCSVCALSSGDASAVGTREFRLDSLDELTGGDLTGAAVDSRGQVRAGLLLGSAPITDATAAWCSMVLADGSVLVGTGNTGKIFKVQAGKVTEFSATGQMAVTALAVDATGALLAGTIPNGKIFKIDGAGKATPYVDLPGVHHVWALAFDPKTKSVFAATGPEGKLFRIDQAGKAQVHYDSDESHLISLAIGGDGTVFTGSSGKAILYRIPAAGRASVMHDFEGDDVKAIAINRDGRMYVISNEHQNPPEVPSHSSWSPTATQPAGPAKPTQLPRPGKGTLTRFEPDGRVEKLLFNADTHYQSLALNDEGVPFVGTGDKGQIYTVDDAHTSAVVADTDERQVGTMVLAGGKKFVVTSDPTVFREVRAIGGPDAVWTSKVLDAGLRSRWGKMMWRADGLIELSTRTGNTEKPDTTWNDWSAPLGTPGPITSLPARYIQVRARFARDPKAVLREVAIPFVTDNARAVITSIDAEMKGAPSKPSSKKDEVPASGDEPAKHNNTVKVSWKIDNPDNDKLRYRVWYRLEGQQNWRAAMLPDVIHTDKDYEWDTSGLPEGTYRVKVEATDELVNPPPQVTRHELTSGTVTVDNTPPVFQELAVAGKRIRGKVVDGVGPISHIDVAVDSQTKFWTPFHPQDGVFDEPVEEFDIDVTPILPAGGGPHIVAIRVYDSAGNMVVRTVEVR